MRIWTYAEVREKIQEEMDTQEESFISEQEYIDYTNEGIKEAESAIHNLYQDYFLTSAPMPLTASEASYDLPSDIFANKIRYIQYKNGSQAYEIKRMRLANIKFVDDSSGIDFWYNLENSAAEGRQIVLYPTPQADDPTSVKVWYIRNALQVAADDDPIDIPEFIEFIFSYMRVKIARKELSPLTANYEAELERQKEFMKQVLDDMIPNEELTMTADMSFYNDFDSDYGCF